MAERFQVLVATSNPHKFEEIGAIFSALGAAGIVTLRSLSDLAERIDEPIEDGDPGRMGQRTHRRRVTDLRAARIEPGRGSVSHGTSVFAAPVRHLIHGPSDDLRSDLFSYRG